MNLDLEVGDVVILKVSVLGVKAETKGVVYETYEDFDIPGKQGASVIFENGDYDGFSFEDQKIFFKDFKFTSKVYLYNFTNVMKLSEDFRNGYWDEIFK